MSAKTSVSASEPYASAGDCLARVDSRLLGDLVRDDGTQATSTELLTDTVLLAALESASGAVESLLLSGGRYTKEDLQALTGNSLSMVKDIVCGVAIQKLRWRRGLMEEPTYPIYKQAMQTIEAIHHGQIILSFAETVEAGLPTTYRMQTSDFFYNTPSLLTNQARAWGVRADRRGMPGYGAF